MFRKTYLEVDLEHIKENYSMVQQRVKNKLVIPVVKANAYGHGVLQVVEALYQDGVRFFAVSLLEEALKIRHQFSSVDILMMGVCNTNDFLIASKHNIQVTVGNKKQLEDLLELNEGLNIHLKIDTGMNRLGYKDFTLAKKAFITLKNHDKINLVGVYTHFATADNNYDFYLKQKDRFEYFLSLVDCDDLMVHVSNSSSAIKYEEDLPYTTHVRLGISLYGLTLDQGTTFLKNTCKLITHISDVKDIQKGEKIGYGATYQALEDERIGILPIGYADGFIRKNQGGFVEVAGQRCEIIGRICMDQMFIRLGKDMDIDSKVVLFGGLISIDEVAKRLGTINYEVICQITSRVPRIYKN